MARTVAIIQARMSSTRLPGKVLMDLAGRPLLAHAVNRVSQAKTLDAVVVATGDLPANKPIEALCRAEGWYIFRGSETDVLDRFFQVALAYHADVVVRVSGDSPLVDPAIIDECVRLVKTQVDYCTNTMPPTFPDGTDVEAFRFFALERAWRNATLPSQREHVTPWIRDNRWLLKYNLTHDPDLSYIRLCVDEEADLVMLRNAMSILGPDCNWKQVVALLLERSELGINQGIERNGSYRRQLETEAKVG